MPKSERAKPHPMSPGNSSGQGDDAIFPVKLTGWNWGAFLMNWIWGRFNNVPMPKRIFVPFFNIGAAYRLGARGNEWAWRNKHWESIDQFKIVQRKWMRAGVTFTFFIMFGFISAAVLGPQELFKRSHPVQLAMSAARQNTMVQQAMGTPLEMRWLISGTIGTSGPNGKADLSIPVRGPEGHATLYFIGERSLGLWAIKGLVLELDESGERLDIVAP